MNLNYVSDIAHVFYVIYFSVRDVLWLRTFSAVGSIISIYYYYLQPIPLMVQIYWGLIFLTLNLYWIVRLSLERRPVKLSEEERRLYQIALRNLKERDAFKLFRLGAWTTEPAGTAFLTQEQGLDCLRLIVSGKVSVEMDGEVVDTIGEGRFIGSTAFLSRRTGHLEPVTARALEPRRVITWQTSELESRFNHDIDLMVALEASLGLELSRFLQSAWIQAAANPSSS